MSQTLEEPQPSRRSARRGKILVAVMSGLIAFVLATAWTQETARRESALGRREQLASLVETRQRRVEDLEAQLKDVRRRMDLASRSASRGQLAEVEHDLARLGLPAGTRAVGGGGIVVSLTDSPLGKRGDPETADFHIQDADLQLVVNALWASGAEAIGINGQRVVGTTAIRSAGGAILVNYRVLTSPYVVTAIGDEARLESAFGESQIARRFKGWVDVYHLGFTIKREKRLSIPAFTGVVRFRFAEPIELKG